ncbi:MAG: hypothetical protein QW101_06460 [Ignisphaera sp.]|uniref:Uncharacterized protein n=1 Tax=Ignisphaera aggregans TaxID=334771 RepID=A0A7J3MXX5_9CREN
MDENDIKRLVSDCERHLAVDDLNSFYTCIDSKGLVDWVKRDVVLIAKSNEFIRLLAYKVVGRDVYSLIAFYSVANNSLKYMGMDVDVSDIDDVKRILGDL